VGNYAKMAEEIINQKQEVTSSRSDALTCKTCQKENLVELQISCQQL